MIPGIEFDQLSGITIDAVLGLPLQACLYGILAGIVLRCFRYIKAEKEV